MYSINGVALHDLSGPRSWGFLAESEPLADLTLARQALTRQGRHGVLAIPGEVLEATCRRVLNARHCGMTGFSRSCRGSNSPF